MPAMQLLIDLGKLLCYGDFNLYINNFVLENLIKFITFFELGIAKIIMNN